MVDTFLLVTMGKLIVKWRNGAMLSRYFLTLRQHPKRGHLRADPLTPFVMVMVGEFVDDEIWLDAVDYALDGGVIERQVHVDLTY